MSKKIICILLLNSLSLYTAQKNPEKVHVDTMADLGKNIIDRKKEKTVIYKRNSTLSIHRVGPRVDGDPEQRKNTQDKK